MPPGCSVAEHAESGQGVDELDRLERQRRSSR
jgi:hypothetical protein